MRTPEKTRFVTVLAGLLLAAPGLAAARVPDLARGPRTLQLDEVRALRALEDPRLDGRRAAGTSAPVGLDAAEREHLRTLGAHHSELATQRAGDLHLSNRELTTVLLVLGIVLLLVIIL